MDPLIGDLQISIHRDNFQDSLDFFNESYLDYFSSGILNEDGLEQKESRFW
jgi:hypothetical protein